MSVRTVILRIGVFSILILVIYAVYKFGPGSYAQAEEYELPMAEQELIARIQAFKRDNPAYNVPYLLGLNDGKRGADDLWYHVYFYYPEEHEIIHT